MKKYSEPLVSVTEIFSDNDILNVSAEWDPAGNDREWEI